MTSLRSFLGLHPHAPRPRVGHLVSTDARLAETAELLVLAPLRHASAGGAVHDSALDAELFARGDDAEPYDVVIVQQGAVPPALVPPVLAECRRRSARLVVVAAPLAETVAVAGAQPAACGDEGLPASGAADGELLAAADAVLVRTPEEAAALEGQVAGEVVVVPVALDPDVWTALAVGADDAPDLYGSPHDRHGLLYLGPPTATAALALLREAVALVGERGHGVHLDVDPLGGAGADGDGLAPRGAAAGTPGAAGIAGDGGAEVGVDIERDAVSAAGPADPVGRARALQQLRGRWVLALVPVLEGDERGGAVDQLPFLEATALGLGTVASEHPALASIETFGGVLCPPDADAWADAIVAALDDRAALAERVETARDHVRAERTDPAGHVWLVAVTGRGL